MQDQQYLIEKNSIIKTVTLLFIKTDEKDWESVKNCFRDEVLFDVTSMGGDEPTKRTPQQIVDEWETGLKEIDAIHHQIGNFLVEINGNKAEVFCYGIASHYKPNPTNNNTRIFVGSYDFSLKKDSKLWKITKFKFNLKYIDGNKDL